MELLGRLRALDGVIGAESTDAGATVVVADRARIPALVADLVAGGVAVYAATPRPKTLEDVYFAYQDTLGEDTAGLLEAMR
jgi:hypothetical protein